MFANFDDYDDDDDNEMMMIDCRLVGVSGAAPLFMYAIYCFVSWFTWTFSHVFMKGSRKPTMAVYYKKGRNIDIDLESAGPSNRTIPINYILPKSSNHSRQESTQPLSRFSASIVCDFPAVTVLDS